MKKKFGQNFLKDEYIIQKIINTANLTKNSNVLEIGPGDGALSKEIIKKKPLNYIAVEIDKSLENRLNKVFANTSYKVIFKDALKFNEIDYFKDSLTLISNLPYNISLPLFIKWTHLTANYTWCSKMILMFQKEVAERIIASENSKKYGRISLLTSAFYKVTKILDVSKKSFLPIPKVDSTILMFEPLIKKKILSDEIKIFENLSFHFFNNRRKKIKNKIEQIFNFDDIKKNNLNNLFDLRAENLNKDIFYKLVKILYKSKLNNSL